MLVTEDTQGFTDVRMRVLASGSSGNCAVVQLKTETLSRLCLVDAGISPKRTAKLLDDMGLSIDQVDDLLITHFDNDHYHRGWSKGVPHHARVWVHARHAGRATDANVPHEQTRLYHDGFQVRDGFDVTPMLLSHDHLGVVAFRVAFRIDGSDAHLGFATDLGHTNQQFIKHLKHVDVLAIESNYCPDMQASSNRPAFLKWRITGGAGHLSNEETMRAVVDIEPRDHVVLLHLSRDCNTPDIVATHHEGADYTLTIAHPNEPTRWVNITPADAKVSMPAPAQLSLFG